MVVVVVVLVVVLMTMSWRGSQAVRSSLRYPLTSWKLRFYFWRKMDVLREGNAGATGETWATKASFFYGFSLLFGGARGDPFSDHMQGQPSIGNPNGALTAPNPELPELPIPAMVSITTITHSLDRGSSCPPPLCNRIKSLVSGDGLLFLGGGSAVVLPASCSQARAAVHRLTPAPPSRRPPRLVTRRRWLEEGKAEMCCQTTPHGFPM